MAHLALSAARRWAQAPLALRIAVIYLVARLITTGFLIAAASLSTSLSRFGADAGLVDFVVGWDAQWYWLVAENGYPSDLPLTESGDVAENAWAFMPVFAYAAKALGFVLGSWGAGALVLSLVAESGYPSELPLTDSGDVAENAWAFMPVFAYAAKALGFVFGLSLIHI